MAWFLMVQIEVSARISDYVRPERRNVWGLWVSLGIHWLLQEFSAAMRRRVQPGNERVPASFCKPSPGGMGGRGTDRSPIRIRFDRDVTIVGYCRIIAGGWEFQPSHILLEDL